MNWLFTTTKRLVRFVVLMGVTIAVLAGAVALISPEVAHLVSAHRSDHERISLKPLVERSLLFDRYGHKIGTLVDSRNTNRIQVALKDVPKTVVGSILATEDNDFYRHKGVNARSILRAVDANLNSGEISQGGSTITQQVVKNSLTGNKQDFKRKIKEALLSVELEKQMSKDDILEYYLNSVFFGNGAYGVAAAAEVYFNKPLKDLNWGEGAMLAALIRSPSNYNPYRFPKLAQRRRDIVFKRLVETKRLTPNERKVYELVPIPSGTPNTPPPIGDYFPNLVKEQLLADPNLGLGATPTARRRSVFGGGLRVYTTYDPIMQLAAIQARDETLPNNQGNGTFAVDQYTASGKQLFGTQAIASVEPSTGALRVMVGGPGLNIYPANLATAGPHNDQGRQPGSSMKTFVMAALFENGYVPADTVSGGRCAFNAGRGQEPYTPATEAFGNGTITTMIQESSNCGFVRLGQVVGIDKVINLAHRMGITTNLQNVLSLPLGTSPVSPIDMAAAYSVLANDGVRNPVYMIDRIEDRRGRVIYQHKPTPEQVVSVQTARLATQVLENNVQRGTGTNAKIASGQPAAGKTGTTNGSANVWFVGYTPQLATAIWMGVPAGNISLAKAGLGGATGGRYPAKTWGDFYDRVLAGQPIVGFAAPDPTRPGHSVGKIPNEIGGSSGDSGSRGNRRGGGGGGGGGGATTPPPTDTGGGPIDLGGGGTPTDPGAGGTGL